MKLIETKTLTTTQSNIELTAIPQEFTDLYLLVSLRGTRGDFPIDGVTVQPNGSSIGLSWRRLLGTGTSAISESGTTDGWALAPTAQTTANTFSNSSLYFSNYTSAQNKSVSIDTVTESNSSSSFFGSQAIVSGTWANTNAITSLNLVSATGNSFVAGSTISLYGIGGVGDGYAAPKATGGTISYTDDGYIVHTFTASGTFTPTANLDCEYLVVAGGGGGGGASSGTYGGSGGGAGGYRESSASLTTGTSYTVTVGAGGSGGPSAGSFGTAGTNSVFNAITSNGGGGGVGSGFDHPGVAGGSGSGGSGNNQIGGAGNTPATSPSQGNNGGTSNGSAPNYGTGGGGGANAVGLNGTSTVGGNGGAGKLSSITGTSVTRAGGGGGGNSYGGTSGSGVDGGGNAGTGSGGAGSSGRAATGGGGGGASAPISGSAFAGGAGGSGIVIVRYAA